MEKQIKSIDKKFSKLFSSYNGKDVEVKTKVEWITDEFEGFTVNFELQNQEKQPTEDIAPYFESLINLKEGFFSIIIRDGIEYGYSKMPFLDRKYNGEFYESPNENKEQFQQNKEWVEECKNMLPTHFEKTPRKLTEEEIALASEIISEIRECNKNLKTISDVLENSNDKEFDKSR